jgi:serine/threonine protein kinase
VFASVRGNTLYLHPLMHARSNMGGISNHALEFQSLSPRMKMLLEKCLEISPSKRIWPKNLIQNQEIFDIAKSSPAHAVGYIAEEKDLGIVKPSYYSKTFCTSCRLVNQDESRDSLNGSDGNERFSQELPTDLLTGRTLNEIYYLWQRAGGDVLSELKRQGLTRKKPAVLSLPRCGEIHCVEWKVTSTSASTFYLLLQINVKLQRWTNTI